MGKKEEEGRLFAFLFIDLCAWNGIVRVAVGSSHKFENGVPPPPIHKELSEDPRCFERGTHVMCFSSVVITTETKARIRQVPVFVTRSTNEETPG